MFGPDLPRRPRALLLAGLALGVVGLPACAPPSTTPAPSSAASGTAAPSTTSSSGTPSTGTPSTGAATVSCSYPEAAQAAKEVQPPPTTDVPATGTVAFTLAMTGGDVTITMDRSKTPCTVNSFASLAAQGYYDGTACHRLADSGIFILQCGDPTGTGSGGPGYSFADELTGQESYTRGSVAMANSGPGTNGSQFFLVWEDSSDALTPDYTLFGSMDKASRDVVAQMAGEGQDGSGGDGTGKPNNPSEIATVTQD